MNKFDILNAYYLRTNPKHGKTTVRTGNYYIKELLSQVEGKREQLAKALWHPSEELFLPDTELPPFIVNLHSLYNKLSVSSKKIPVPLEKLLNSVVKIECVTLEEDKFDGKPSKSYKVVWELSRWVDEEEVLARDCQSVPVVSESDDEEAFEEDIDETELADDEHYESELMQLLYDEYIANLQNEEEAGLLYDWVLQKEIDDDLLAILLDKEEDDDFSSIDEETMKARKAATPFRK